MRRGQAHEEGHGDGREVSDAIDAIGFGWFQVLVLVMTGGIMFAEGAEMLVMGSITTLLHDHWDLEAVIRGLMVSVVFVGFSMGNLLSGQIGDRWGRRRGILIAYAMIGTCGFATASARSPWEMLALRFLVGVGCGIGFPSVYSLIPEVCPTHLRGSVCTLMIGFMPLGELYAASGVLLVDPYLNRSTSRCELGYYPSRSLANPEECSWKALCEFSALPALVCLGLAALFLHESPHFLAANGRRDEMEVVLSAMARMNGKAFELQSFKATEALASPKSPRLEGHEGETSAPPIQPNVEKYSFVRAVSRLVSTRFLCTTLFMFLAHFTKDFSVFGLSYVLPQYFAFLRTMSAGLQLIAVSALSLPGVALAYLITRSACITHVVSLSLSAGLSGIFALGMLEIFPNVIGAPCAYLVKILALVYFIITVVYTTEVFPTEMRNTAVGLCTCMGRLGSIFAPLLFEISRDHWRSFDVFAVSLAVSMLVVATTAPLCLTIDPKGVFGSGVQEHKSYGSVS